MKNVVITLLFLMICVGASRAQDAVHKATIIVATYSGNSTDGYYFTNDLDQKDIQFAKIEPEVLEKYDLNGSTYLNKTFRVAYINDPDAGNTTPDSKGAPKKIIDLALINESDDE